MITKEQSEILQRELPTGYASTVQERLIEKGKFTRKNTPYATSMISNVMMGKRANPDIEEEIFDLYAEIKGIVEKRDELLGIKKPEAATPGDV